MTFDGGKIINVGTKILLCSFKNSAVEIEEYSDSGTLSAEKEEITITCNHSDTIKGGEYFILNSPLTNYYVWYTKDNEGENPYVGESVGIKVNVYTDDDATVVATKTAAAINALDAFNASSSAEVVTVENTLGGECPDSIDGNTQFNVEVTKQGYRKMLFDGTLGTDVVQILDITIAADGSAKILATVKYPRKFKVGRWVSETVKFRPTFITKPAGWITL
jgi:hypothetical protein